MNAGTFDKGPCDVAWCPGCGNFAILNLLKKTLQETEIHPEDLVMVSGIGQAAKIPQYLRCHYFNGLHGRALPPAIGIKVSNPRLTLIAESGDGDMYGEGGNHFIHAIRRNPNITNIVHDNMVYGLTKGQASPTSQPGFKTPVQVQGVFSEPFNPLAVAIALNCSFVARIFSGHQEESVAILKEAIQHKGYALVDIFQPCVTFNRVNTFKWFKEHTHYLDASHNRGDRSAAFARSLEADPLLLGVFYVQEGRPTFEESTGLYEKEPVPLFQRQLNVARVSGLIESGRTH